MDEGAARRAQARRHWPVVRHRLGAEAGEDLSGSTTAEERLAMVWELAVRAWRLAGLEIPTYDRRQAPGRVLRPGS